MYSGVYMSAITSPLSLLKDPSLLKTDALINGQWVKVPADLP
jgi:succinate-semialdehyde dehydrogenase/glutarate-semialdehyde dehydrogenase